jgi:chaperonin GroEL
MGPSGKNVLIERPGQSPILTKDGVTVARAINLREKFQNLGVQIVREAAQSTAEEAGDGTTTATLLASQLFEAGLKAYAAGHDLNEIKTGILEGSQNVIEQLQKSAKSIETRDELFRVANISVNGEEQLAELIVKAIDAVGQHGPISVTESKGFESSLEVVDGCSPGINFE